MNHYKNAFKKYADFRTRARRSEYWYFALFNALFILLLSLLDTVLGFGNNDTLGVFAALYSIAVVIPGFAVFVRRLHDIGKSGWWILIGLVPFVGAILLFLFTIRDGQPGVNQYGPNPKETNGSSGMSGSVASVPASFVTQTDAMPIENNFTRPAEPVVPMSTSDVVPSTTPTSNLS